MAFEWYEVSAGGRRREDWPSKHAEAQRREVRERAALLMRLGRSKEQAVQRCRQNIEWQYALRGGSSVASEVQALVDEVYGRTLTLDPSVAGDV